MNNNSLKLKPHINAYNFNKNCFNTFLDFIVVVSNKY